MAEQIRVLRRLPQRGQLAGVCAGLAEYTSIDVTLLRVIFVILAIVTGGGFILIYILLAIVMPPGDEKGGSKNSDIGQNIQILADDFKTNGQKERLRNFIGLGFIVLGVWLLIGQLFPGWASQSWNYIWPILLILLGGYIATRRSW